MSEALPPEGNADPGSTPRKTPQAVRELVLAAEDGVRLAGENIPPAAAPFANLLVVHGMCEHAGRYRPFAGFMASRGVGVYGFDLRAHGRTGRLAGEAGYLTLAGGWEPLVRDIGVWADFIQRENPGLPLFLLGHSLGSFLARGYASSQGQKLGGLILSGTGNIPGVTGAILRAAAKIEDELNGKKEPGTLISRFMFRMFARSVKHRRTRFDWLSRDEKTVDAYMADPLCGKPMPTGFLYDFFRAARDLRKPGVLQKTPRGLPVYIFSGSRDPVGNFSKGVTEVYKEYQKAGIANITLKLYSGGRHEMLGETNREEVWRDVFAWLKGKTENSPRIAP
jgi:alpha-beta hydrolase superfamily lysophospholipase